MRVKIAVLFALLVGAGVVLALTIGGPKPPLDLARSWQLTHEGRYRAMGVTDPFLAWSPDSRSVLFGVYGLKSQKDYIYKWDVGENELKRVAEGTSPTYVNNDEFIYLKRAENPPTRTLIRQDLRTGVKREIIPSLKATDFWTEMRGVSYDPKRKTIVLRLTEYTPFNTPGPDEYDLNGRRVGPISTRLSEQIMDYSWSPDGSQCAILVQEEDGMPISLQIAAKGKSRGTQIDTGDLGSVAWSPDGRAVAYASSKRVIAYDPKRYTKRTIGVFGDPDDQTDKRYVARLIWSPNGRYLAVFVYVPNDAGDYPLYYVLDMSGSRSNS